MADIAIPKTAPGSFLAEVAEVQATGVQREIYAEIRRWSAVPFVALIYRHLAASPGALEWAWDVLQPAMARGILQERAWQLAARIDIPTAPLLPRAALRVAGVDAEDEAQIVDILKTYNRANPINFLAVKCLALMLEADPHYAPRQLATPTWSPPVQVPGLPDMIAPAEMSPPVRAAAALLANRDGSEASALWPSLYRHLARWPAFLGYATVLVTPAFAAIDAAAADFGHEIELVAAELSTSGVLGVRAGRARPDLGESLRAAIQSFSRRIPEMVVIGNMLQRSLPTSPSPPSTEAAR